jgi:hypothetical protein
MLPHRATADAATALTGLSLSQLVSGASTVLQLAILVMTLVLLWYRIRNARRGKAEE